MHNNLLKFQEIIGETNEKMYISRSDGEEYVKNVLLALAKGEPGDNIFLKFKDEFSASDICWNVTIKY